MVYTLSMDRVDEKVGSSNGKKKMWGQMVMGQVRMERKMQR